MNTCTGCKRDASKAGGYDEQDTPANLSSPTLGSPLQPNKKAKQSLNLLHLTKTSPGCLARTAAPALANMEHAARLRLTGDEGALPHKLPSAHDSHLLAAPIRQGPHDGDQAVANDEKPHSRLAVPHQGLPVLQGSILGLCSGNLTGASMA